MSRNYTKREIASLLNCSVSTIEKDAAYLNIEPSQGDRGINLYSEKDFNLISQMRKHCQDKSNNRDSFIPNTEVEILDIEPKVTKMVQDPKIDYRINKYCESIDYGLNENPLFDLELLQKISDNSWLLPTKRLAPLFNISPKYLNSKDKYYYCGFIATKEIKNNNRIFWKVEANNS